MGKQISSLSVVLGATVAPFVSAFGGLKSTVTGFVSSMSSAAGTMLRLTGIGGLVAGAFAAIKGAASGISLASELEQTEIAFKTMLGSGDAATAMMQNLQKFAADTPFEFPEIASAAKKLIAFGVGTGDITDKLKMLGDISAGTGKDLNELASIYGKIKSRGQLTGETLNQLAEAGVPIYKTLASTMGVAESQVAGLVTAGKIGFPQVDAALSSLTATGGQFHGLMDELSRSLGGLWSTLSDNIGMTVAGLVRTVADAFHLKDAMSALITFTGTAGAAINTFVATYAPLVVSWASSIWNAIVNAASAIYGYVAPIVGSIYQVIAANWQGIVSTTVAYWTSAYNLIAALLGAAWNVVSTVWSGIAAVWAWGCDLIGYSTTETGTITGNVVQGIVDWWQWAMSTVSQVLALFAYGINNASTIIEYFGTSAAYYLVKFANQVEWGFNAAVEYVKWFGQNFVNLLVDDFNLGATITQNGIANVAAIISNLPGLIAGTTNLSDIWTPLTQGFESTVSALPTIADRIPGELEQALGAQSEQLGNSIVDGAMNALDDLDKSTASTANQIASTVGGFADQIAAAKPPEIKTPTLDTKGVVTAADAMQNLTDKTKEAKASWDALAYGSAEAQQTRAMAALQAQLGSSSGASAAATSASPLPKSATAAIAKSATDKAGGKDDLTTIVKAFFDYYKANPPVALTEAA